MTQLADICGAFGQKSDQIAGFHCCARAMQDVLYPARGVGIRLAEGEG